MQSNEIMTMSEHKIGVLLLNLGTPNSPKTSDVRRYLNQFLSDPRVIDLPWIVRKILLNVIILPFRSAQSAKAYQMIWDSNGSPLLFHTKSLGEKVQAVLGEKYHVEIGMRYGNPSILHAVDNLLKSGCQKIVIFPLFPQYSSAATGSAIQDALQILNKKWDIPALLVYKHFYNNMAYITAQAEMIKPYLQRNTAAGVLFSYHSLPVRHIKKNQNQCINHCDINPCAQNAPHPTCYRAQCYETSRLLAEKLGLTQGKYRVAFQSRLGRTKWIGPDVESSMQMFIDNHVQDLVVACPSFVADCLETLEEIGMRAKETWIGLGGKTFTLVPCLNADPNWVNAVAEFILTAKEPDLLTA